MDFTGKGLKAVPTPFERDSHRKLVLDENSLTKLKGIEEYRCLETLSVARNRLVRLPPSSFASLRNLRVLNLEQNSLFDVQGLSCLPMLEWLNLSGNSLKDFSGVIANVRLSHLDLSDNSISDLFDISQLRHLKALLLHGNVLTSIQKAPNCLPSCLCLLTLADNEIHDLTQFFTLTHLASSLANLTVANNPALLMTGQSMGFDYRPYFLSICPNLKTLDGFTIADDERQRANHLFPPTTKSPYKLGQHRELVEYLSSLLPLTQARQLHQTAGLRREKDDVLKLHQQHIEAQFLEYQDEQRRQLQRLFQQQEELLRQSRTSLATSSPLNDSNATEIYVATAELTKSKSESTLVLEDLEDELADLHETSLLTSTSEYVPLPPGGQVFSPQKASNSFANETENKHDAAIVIQSWIRGHQLRERLRPFVEETRAAVKIQAAWRGHCTRKRDLFVREMKREIRCNRMEAHLIDITQTLTDTQRELVKESQLRRRQEESIARLWDEVRSLNRKNDWNAAATCIQSAWRRYRTRKKKTVENSHVSLNDVSSQVGSLLEAVNDLESQVKGSEDTSLSFKLESDSASSISDGDGAVDSSPTDLKATIASPLSLQNSGGSLSSSKSPREKAEDLLSSLEHQLSQNNKLMTSTDSEGQQTPGSMCSFYSLPPKLAALATTSQSTASGTNQQ